MCDNSRTADDALVHRGRAGFREQIIKDLVLSFIGEVGLRKILPNAVGNHTIAHLSNLPDTTDDSFVDGDVFGERLFSAKGTGTTCCYFFAKVINRFLDGVKVHTEEFPGQ